VAKERDEQSYEAPAVVELGPIEDLTLGAEPGQDVDGANTYPGDAG
jgi:hypothetical protein